MLPGRSALGNRNRGGPALPSDGEGRTIALEPAMSAPARDDDGLSRDTPMAGVAFDGPIDLDSAGGGLPWAEVQRFGYGRVYRLDGGRTISLFGFGAVVEDGSPSVTSDVIAHVERVTGRRALGSTAETLRVTVDPESPDRPRVGWDTVRVPERTPELIGAIALLLGQSVALERYEHAADQLLDEAQVTARFLAERGRPPRRSRPEIERIGRLSSHRLELSNLFFLKDRPEDTWEHPRVAQLYDALFSNLELEPRHQAMLDKFAAVESLADRVVSLWESRVANRLEWAIVLLIVLEIVMTIVEKL
jgi:uncharacterized Rmd1/YagE family protein